VKRWSGLTHTFVFASGNWSYVAHYNFCRVHEALRVTPAMGQGIADHIWTVSELVAACLRNAPDEPRKRPPTPWKPRVIEGGRK
jgi:hypothetical protein